MKGAGDVNYDVPSTGETFAKFFLDILLFLILTWYFDHVDSSNRGKNYSKLFFFEKKYWCKVKPEDIERKRITESSYSTVFPESYKVINPRSQQLLGAERSNLGGSPYEEGAEYEEGIRSVQEEKEKIIRTVQEDQRFEGLRVLGISKTYKISNTCCGTKNVHALKETYLGIKYGELLTILGHNGAGKSTLINILTGNISPTEGTAKINDSDLLYDPEAVEQLVGLCPQHDILWEELTAKEHIELYANLRGIINDKIYRHWFKRDSKINSKQIKRGELDGSSECPSEDIFWWNEKTFIYSSQYNRQSQSNFLRRAYYWLRPCE